MGIIGVTGRHLGDYPETIRDNRRANGNFRGTRITLTGCSGYNRSGQGEREIEPERRYYSRGYLGKRDKMLDEKIRESSTRVSEKYGP